MASDRMRTGTPPAQDRHHGRVGRQDPAGLHSGVEFGGVSDEFHGGKGVFGETAADV